MELSKEIVEWCKYEALGQCLTEWGEDNALSYEEVIARLRFADEADDIEEIGKAVEPLLIWEVFDDKGWGWIADQIASLYDSYINCAEFALGFDIPNSEGLTPRQLNSIVEQIAEDE